MPPRPFYIPEGANFNAPQQGQAFIGRYFPRQNVLPRPVIRPQQQQLTALQIRKQEWDESEAINRRNEHWPPLKMWSETPAQYRTALTNWRLINTQSKDEKLFRKLEERYLTAEPGGQMDAHMRVHFDDQVKGIEKYKGPHQQRGWKR
jgi:hypothetical protein